MTMITETESVTKTTIRNGLLWIADLLEAHFVVGQHEEKQYRAIAIASRLAERERFMPPIGVSDMQELFVLLHDLKSYSMHNENGFPWVELVRKDIRDLMHDYQIFVEEQKSWDGSLMMNQSRSYIFPGFDFNRKQMMERKRRRMFGDLDPAMA